MFHDLTILLTGGAPGPLLILFFAVLSPVHSGLGLLPRYANDEGFIMLMQVMMLPNDGADNDDEHRV